MWVFVLKTSGGPHEADLDVLWEAGASGLEERDGEVRAFFARKTDLPLRGAWEEQEERDWQAEWKAGLKPVHAGRITIVPPWLRDDVPEGQLLLVIDVGMAFGTGHHETTRMAVEALGRLELRGGRVLDVGTGSGVLAIAAVLLGASEALGVDLDPVTIPAANENARLNGLEEELDAGRLTFLEGTLSDAGGGPYDVVVANLYAELHDMLMSQYPVISDGTLILTGILNSKLPVVLAALDREGFTPTDVHTDGDWALVVASPR